MPNDNFIENNNTYIVRYKVFVPLFSLVDIWT